MLRPVGQFRILLNDPRSLLSPLEVGADDPRESVPGSLLRPVLSGKGIVRIKDASFAVGPQTAVFIPKDSLHGIEADLGEDLTYIMVYAPPGPEKQLRNKEKD